MANVGYATNTYMLEAQSRNMNMMNICTKYGFNILIVSGSYGGHRRHTTDNTTGIRAGTIHRYIDVSRYMA